MFFKRFRARCLNVQRRIKLCLVGFLLERHMNWVIYIYKKDMDRHSRVSINGDLVCECFFHPSLQTAGSFITEFEVSDCPGPSEKKAGSLAAFLRTEISFYDVLWIPMILLKPWPVALVSALMVI